MCVHQARKIIFYELLNMKILISKHHATLSGLILKRNFEILSKLLRCLLYPLDEMFVYTIERTLFHNKKFKKIN